MKSTAICLLSILFGSALAGQDISGAIQGTILDPSGSAVPKAAVSLVNTERNQTVRTTKSNAGGIYSAPLIPIGTYAVRVEAAGFKTTTRTGVVLNVNDDLKIDIKMEIGPTSETVEVKESPLQVELGSPASSSTIDGTQVRELALGSRNYEQLVALMPGVSANPTDELYVGVSAPSGLAATLPYSVNGMRNSANNWTVDGADNVDRGSNLTLMTFPSVDAISQFKVERASYTADTGRAGGAQINVVTRSGTSKFHGSLYEFFRNDALAANNWANNANRVNLVNGAAKIPPLRWNDFGGTLGGPVVFGRFNRARNKTFFFYSQEEKRIVTYTTFNPTLPTLSMLQGNFLQPVCISAVTGGCPAGSAPVRTIPASLIDANSMAYIKDIFAKLPLLDGQTVAATTAGFFPQRNLYNFGQQIVRVDHSFSEGFNVWGKFENDSIPTTEPGGLFTGSVIPNGATTNTNAPGRAYVVHVTYVIRPSLLSDAGFNFNQSAIHARPSGLTAKSNAPDINPSEPYPNREGVVPSVTFTGGSSIVGYGPYDEYNRNYNFFDNLTWLKGRHTLKFGFTSNRYNKTENAAGQQGVFNFSNSGAPSGTSSFQQSFANFLLGNVATFTQPSTDITPNIWAWQHEAFAQDDFKANSRLTAYLGVRWSYFGQPTDTRNLLTNFDPALYSRANAPRIDPANGNVVAGTGTNPLSNGIIVGGVSSPFGEKVGNDLYRNFAPRVGLAWDPFGKGRDSVRAGYGLYYDSGLFGTYEQNAFANPPYVQSSTYSNASFSAVSGGTLGVSAAPLGLHATQVPARIPYSQQWNLTLQRRFPKDMLLEVAYVGSKGTHLLGIVDINEAPPGVALAAGLHTVTAANRTRFTTADDPRINAIRPYQGWNYINALETAFDSNYHSLQVSFRKNFRGGGLLGAAYTYAKNLTDNGSDRSTAPQNSYNWREGEYGPYPGDRTHVFTMNYVYHLPFFQSTRGAARHALHGWEASGIVSAYTGQPFTVTTSGVDPAGLGLLGSSAASSRPDMVCNPQTNAPHTYGGSAQSSAQGLSWFNAACFAPVPDGQVRPGNAGRGVVRGPGFFNWDGSVFKNFAVTERVRVQLRGEAFNVLNWVNPNGFASTNITSTVFGQISSFRAPRRVQLALKLTF